MNTLRVLSTILVISLGIVGYFFRDERIPARVSPHRSQPRGQSGHHRRQLRGQLQGQPQQNSKKHTSSRGRVSSEEEYHPICDAPCRAYIPPSHGGQQNLTEDDLDSCQSAVLKAVSDYENFHYQTHKKWLQVCSTNTTETTTANNTTTTGLDPFCNSVKFLAFGCAPYQKCGGMGDRMKVLSSLYYLAILSKRVLLFRSDKNWEIRDYLEPNRINWDYRDWPNLPYKLEHRIENYNSSTVSEGYKPNREDEYYGCTRAPISPEKICASVLFTAKYSSGPPRFFEDTFNEIAPEACGPNLHELTSLFERQSIRAGAISSLFKLSEIVENKVAEMKKQVGDPENCIVIRSRTIELQNVNSTRPHRPPSVRGVQHKRFLLAEKLNEKYNKTFQWILIADEEKVKEEEKERYPDLMTFDTTPTHTNSKGDKVSLRFEGAKLDSLVDTISEFYMLGYCDILIRGISGFSMAAEWFHGVEKVRDREVYEFAQARL